MFTAIVLDSDSAAFVKEVAAWYGLAPVGWDLKCHHVTLAMGKADFTIGEGREMIVTHCGQIAGRVSAFRVAGASDSVNKVPHVTVAVAKGVKPVESNQITEWRELAPFKIRGKIEICY